MPQMKAVAMIAMNEREETSPLPLAKVLLATVLQYRLSHPACHTATIIQATRVLETYFRGKLAGHNPAEPRTYETEQYYQGQETIPELLTLPEAAAFLQMTPHQLYRLYYQDKITGRKIGQVLYFSNIDLLEWRQSGQDPTTDDGRALAESESDGENAGA